MQRRAAQQLAAAFGKKLSANARQPCGSTQALTWQECGFSTKAYWDTPGFCNQISNPKDLFNPHIFEQAVNQQAWRSTCSAGIRAPSKHLMMRWQSTAPDVKAAQQNLSQAIVKGKAATKDTVSRASSSIFARLPAKARTLITDASQPGNLQRALKLQLEAFWGNHNRKILALGGALVVYALWRSLFGFASMFFKLSETMADFGFLALSAAIASFAFLYIRRLYTINPDSVYRLAMLQLNTNPAILEVMGAPVAGSSVRATVTTGGGLRMKGFQPKFRSRRVQMIFPLTGSERRGLVSLEAKKLKGKYLFKLLAIDVPTASGSEQRLFVEGDEKAYSRGGVIGELRDPFLQALSLKEANELEDEIDDAAADADAEQAKRAKKVTKLRGEPKPMDKGEGMYFYERALLGLQQVFRSSPGKAGADPSASPQIDASPPKPAPKGQPPAQAAETLDPGTIPKNPTGEGADKLHQYKKEASSQQAP